MTAATKQTRSGFDRFQEQLAAQQGNYDTRWVFTPLTKCVAGQFPHLSIQPGKLTPIEAHTLAIHYGIKELDEETIKNSNGAIMLCDNGTNYVSFASTRDVVAQLVQQNAGYGAIELNELQGVSGELQAELNELLCVEGDAETQLRHLQNVVVNPQTPPKYAAIAQKLIESITRVQAESLNVVARAKTAIESGKKTSLDEYDFACFRFSGEALVGTDRFTKQPAPASMPAPTIDPVLAEILKNQQQQGAEMAASIKELAAAIAGNNAKPKAPAKPEAKA